MSERLEKRTRSRSTECVEKQRNQDLRLLLAFPLRLTLCGVRYAAEKEAAISRRTGKGWSS